jgi:hypothetical protein
MKFTLLIFAAFAGCIMPSLAEVTIDEQAFGKSLGGWKKNDKSITEYSLSGADYRTYKPEFSPTPEGGIFVSVRIDNVRGWLATNDHATLEITVNPKGAVVSAQSNIAIQGRSIKSDVILGAADATKTIVNPDFAVQVGADLVANLSAKLLRENIVEAGRVSFPAVIRHNFNHLFQAIRVEVPPVAQAVAGEPAANEPVVAAPNPPTEVKTPAPVLPTTPTPPSEGGTSPVLEIKPYR